MRPRIALLVLALVTGIGGMVIYLESGTLAVARPLDVCREGTGADTHEEEIVEFTAGGRPPDLKAPAADIPVPDIAAGINTLSNVPAFDWSYGCSATSAAMLFGYYDRTGYSNMYAGPTNSGVCPLDNSIWGDTTYPSVTCHECPLSATHQGVDGRAIKGHVDDYWIDYENAGPDPYVGNWTEHAQGDCTGDYMGTNQSDVGNSDGSTSFWYYPDGDPLYDFTGGEPADIDGCHGMKDFAVSRGYAVQTNFNQLIQGQGTDPAKGFTFSQYVAEIDAGRPVLIHVEGHTMLGYGYNTTGNVVNLRDTWDHSSHDMTWGGTYHPVLQLQHYGVTVIRLNYSVTITIETSGLVSSYPATVHYSEGGVPKMATTYGSWSGIVDYGSAVSIDSSVAVSTTERYGTSATTSWTATELATYPVPYYHQFKPLVSAVTAGAGHADLDSTNYAALTYYRYGSQGVFGVFDSYSFSDWADAGSTLTLASLSSGSTLTHRWYSSEATSWTVSDAGSHSATYWDQCRPTVSVVTNGQGHADLDATNCVTLTYYQYGVAGTLGVFDGQGFNDWMDTGSTVGLSNPSSGSTATRRWHCTEATSWAVSDAGSHSVTYWDQFKPSFSVTTAGTDHTDLNATNCASLTYSQHGVVGTFSLFDGQAFNDWIDTGSMVGLSNSSSGSTLTHRWYCLGTTMWAVNDASTHSAIYWEQLKPTVTVTTSGTGHSDLDNANCATLAYVRGGESGTFGVFDRQSFSDWVDKGSTASLSETSTGSTSTHRWYATGTTSWAITDTKGRSATYREQLLVEIPEIGGLDSSHPTTITFTRDGVASSLTAFDSWTGWADAGSTVSVAKSVEGGWIGDWSTGDVTEWDVVSPTSDSIGYRRSYAGLYALVGGLLAALVIVGLAVFLLFRIRRSGYGIRDLADYFSDRLG